MMKRTFVSFALLTSLVSNAVSADLPSTPHGKKYHIRNIFRVKDTTGVCQTIRIDWTGGPPISMTLLDGKVVTWSPTYVALAADKKVNVTGNFHYPRGTHLC